MFLLFFLMVAAGMLSLLWLYFPMQGGTPQESIPYPVPATLPAASQPATVPPPPEAPVAAAAMPDGAEAAAAMPPAAAAGGANASAGNPTYAVPGPGPAPASAGAPGVPSVPGPAPGATSVEELDRLLEKLLGNAPPVPPTRP